MKDFAHDTTAALRGAEQELTRIHTSLTVVASLMGRPKRAVNAGSAWGAIEAMDDRFDVSDTNTGTLLAQQHVTIDH